MQLLSSGVAHTAVRTENGSTDPLVELGQRPSISWQCRAHTLREALWRIFHVRGPKAMVSGPLRAAKKKSNVTCSLRQRAANGSRSKLDRLASVCVSGRKKRKLLARQPIGYSNFSRCVRTRSVRTWWARTWWAECARLERARATDCLAIVRRKKRTKEDNVTFVFNYRARYAHCIKCNMSNLSTQMHYVIKGR